MSDELFLCRGDDVTLRLTQKHDGPHYTVVQMSGHNLTPMTCLTH